MSAFIQFKDVKKTYKVGDVEIHASNGVNFEFKIVVLPAPLGPTITTNSPLLTSKLTPLLA